MPNVDGGHYFLTVLFPVLAEPIRRADGSVTSAVASLREALASLPTAQQSAACVAVGHHSPFSRCDRTHFARLVVIDQPAFNGRDAGNAILQAVRKTDLLAHQRVDALTRTWLLLAIDFDAGAGTDHGMHDYLVRLWTLMAPELTDVLRHCHGFEQPADAERFAAYVQDCQVETTMPFNDYWSVPATLPSVSLGRVAGIGLGIAVGTMLLVLMLVRVVGISDGWTWLALPLAVLLAAFGMYRFVAKRGSRAFPIAPDSDLRSILKALYVQQRFADFAIAHQGGEPGALHEAFSRFVADHRPADRAAPTQLRGVVG